MGVSWGFPEAATLTVHPLDMIQEYILVKTGMLLQKGVLSIVAVSYRKTQATNINHSSMTTSQSQSQCHVHESQSS